MWWCWRFPQRHWTMAQFPTASARCEWHVRVHNSAALCFNIVLFEFFFLIYNIYVVYVCEIVFCYIIIWIYEVFNIFFVLRMSLSLNMMLKDELVLYIHLSKKNVLFEKLYWTLIDYYSNKMIWYHWFFF